MMAFGIEAGEGRSICAYGLAAVIVVHVMGVLWYSIRHAENITLSMIHGTKECDAGDSISSNHTTVGILFLLTAVLLYHRPLSELWGRRHSKQNFPF